MDNIIAIVLIEQGRRQKWLCEQTGISPSKMSRIVNGHQVPWLDEALNISRALGVTVEDLWPVRAAA